MTTAATVIAGAGVIVVAVPVALIVAPALRRKARPHATVILLSWVLALGVMIGAGWVEAGNIRDRCRDAGGVWVGRVDQGDCVDRSVVIPLARG